VRNAYNDQSIYGWRLADVRRVLSLADELPGLRRVDLEVNYRCPPTVVARAVRLVEHNRERFVKTIRAGPAAAGPVVLAADGSDETVRIGRVLDAWPVDADTRAILARTNRELLPAISAALDRRLPFRPPAIVLVHPPACTGRRSERDVAHRDRRGDGRLGNPLSGPGGLPHGDRHAPSGARGTLS
jgi:hypothetical protein